MSLLERRVERFKDVLSKRQLDIAILLENVHDPHNIGAVMRSCDSVGIQDVIILNTDPRLQDRTKYEHLSTSSGAAKWMSIHYFEEIVEAVNFIKSTYKRLITTHLSSDAKSLYNFDFSDSFCLAFGIDHECNTEELLSHSVGNLIIPQFGMVQSLFLSVACAVCLFEVCRQRVLADAYEYPNIKHSNRREELLGEWIEIHKASKRK